MYLYYDLSTCIAAIRKGLTGPGPVPTSHLSQSWNIHTWELN
jgi:hypothetical protein